MSALTKRELRKAAYQMIFKEGKSHQETFDKLRETKSMASDDLAELIAKIPSRQKLKEQNVLNYAFIGLLSAIIILRGLSLAGLGSTDMGILSIALLIAFIVPGIGIYGALAGKTELYFSTGALLLITIIRTITNQNFSNDPLNYVFTIPIVLASVLAFYLPSKLKTSYRKTIERKEVDGVVKPVAIYQSEENRFFREDLLDS
ncbi:hypothetical protein D3C87_14980 [compost metagenome]